MSLDFTVDNLNRLHLAKKLVKGCFRKCKYGTPGYGAYLAAWTAIASDILHHQKIVAEECAPWFDESAFDVEYEWHSTPQLWLAYRHGYDGANDSHCKIGYGKTKQEAAADLIQKETE